MARPLLEGFECRSALTSVVEGSPEGAQLRLGVRTGNLREGDALERVHQLLGSLKLCRANVTMVGRFGGTSGSRESP